MNIISDLKKEGKKERQEVKTTETHKGRRTEITQEVTANPQTITVVMHQQIITPQYLSSHQLYGVF